MRDTVRCPSCKAILVVPPVLPEGEVSCPRCLAVVPLPRTETVAAPEAIQAAPPAPAPSAEPAAPAESRCSHCGKAVQPEWRFCPSCEEPLQGTSRPSRRKTADQDVRRDSKGSSILLGILVAFGGLGVIWYFAAAASSQDSSAIGGGVLILLLAALVSTGLMFFQTRHNPTQRSVGRVVTGTFGLIGMVFAGGCTLLAAFCVFFFVICLAGGFKWH